MVHSPICSRFQITLSRFSEIDPHMDLIRGALYGPSGFKYLHILNRKLYVKIRAFFYSIIVPLSDFFFHSVEKLTKAGRVKLILRPLL